LSIDGQPYITTVDANNTLEYWSVDWADNEEFPHKFLCEIKLDKINPTIGVPSWIPSDYVKPSQEVKVTVNVTDIPSGVENVTLSYTVTNGAIWKNLTMTYNTSTHLYESVIPGQPDGTLVVFKIVAYDHVGNKALKDNSGRYYTYSVHYTYELTITTTTGGNTDPVPGAYLYWSGTTVGITAVPYDDHLFDHWELNNANVGSANPYTVLMDKNQTLKAVFSPILPLSASISPFSASIQVGDSLTFTSTIIGGVPPYSYQWYLNGTPVSYAIFSSWTFTPTTKGTYNVYVVVTDNAYNIIQSEPSRITITAKPVGGYSFPIGKQTVANPLTPYLILTAILAAVFTSFRCKRRHKPNDFHNFKIRKIPVVNQKRLYL
jgi:hypothetical protein